MTGVPGSRALIRVREAATSNAVEACDLVRSSVVGLCAPDHGGDRGRLAAMLADKTPDNVRAWIVGGHVFVAERESRMAGVAALTKTGDVTLLHVAPTSRLTGVSRALLMALEERARDLGIGACRVETTLTAHRFFLDAGYEDLGRSRLVKTL